MLTFPPRDSPHPLHSLNCSTSIFFPLPIYITPRIAPLSNKPLALRTFDFHDIGRAKFAPAHHHYTLMGLVCTMQALRPDGSSVIHFCERVTYTAPPAIRAHVRPLINSFYEVRR